MKSMFLAPLALVGALAAIATSTAAAPSTGGHCFWVRNVDSFRSMDNRTVYIRVGGRDVFELTLFAPCLNVDWAHRIALRARGSSNICEGRMSTLEVHATSRAFGRQRCTVTSVRWLSPDEVAALPRLARP